MTGKTVGNYIIEDRIGVGGMGEVYRAKDARLGRLVAVKVLPANFAGDADRAARFEREAKVLAGLNHPNISVAAATTAAPPEPNEIRVVLNWFEELKRLAPTPK